MTATPPATAGLERELIAALAEAGHSDGEVRALARLSGGASRETWSFELAAPDGSVEDLVLQRERPGGGGAGQAGMEVEAALLELAGGAGVPVPGVVLAGGHDSALGAPFMVTRRVEGETIPRRLLRDDAFAGARASLATEAGEALGRIHQVPLDDVTPLLDLQDPIELFRDILDAFDEPHPAFELAFRWLDRNRPEAGAPALVHGDFRTGNLIVSSKGLGAVIDWELAHLGDALEDLGWFCVRAWRFGSPLRAGGFGSVEQLLEGYRASTGRSVDPEVVRWWEVVGTLRWGIICMVQASTHLTGTSRSVELATIGRRTCENEYDLLGLIR